MHYGRMKSRKEAEEYIKGNLLKVKEILDDIADQTGIVFLCISGGAAEMFGRVGNAMSESLIEIMKIIPDRMDLADKAMEAAYKADSKEADCARQGHLLTPEDLASDCGTHDEHR